MTNTCHYFEAHEQLVKAIHVRTNLEPDQVRFEQCDCDNIVPFTIDDDGNVITVRGHYLVLLKTESGYPLGNCKLAGSDNALSYGGREMPGVAADMESFREFVLSNDDIPDSELTYIADMIEYAVNERAYEGHLEIEIGEDKQGFPKTMDLFWNLL